MRKNANSDYYLLIGRVEEFYEDSNRFTVKVSYEILNRAKRMEETAYTTIYFEDQQKRNDGRRPIPWAQIAKGKRLHKGSVIAVVVYFVGNGFEEAYGYAINYSGIVWLGSNEETDEEKNAVGGIVNWMSDKIDQSGMPYLSMGVFYGYDRYGNAMSAVVQVRDEKLMQRCKQKLMPMDDGTRASAWFKCGSPYDYRGRDGRNHRIYTAFDMTKTGTYTQRRKDNHEDKRDQNPELQG